MPSWNPSVVNDEEAPAPDGKGGKSLIKHIFVCAHVQTRGQHRVPSSGALHTFIYVFGTEV